MAERIKLATLNNLNNKNTYILNLHNRNILVGDYILYAYPENKEKTSELSKLETDKKLKVMETVPDKISKLVNLVIYNKSSNVKDLFFSAEEVKYTEKDSCLSWDDEDKEYPKYLYDKRFSDFIKLKSEKETIYISQKLRNVTKKNSDTPVKVEINKYMVKYTFADGAILIITKNRAPEELYFKK